jgi:hypothetical protein
VKKFAIFYFILGLIFTIMVQDGSMSVSEYIFTFTVGPLILIGGGITYLGILIAYGIAHLFS